MPRAEIERPEDVHVELVAHHLLELLADWAGEDLVHVIDVAEQIGGRHHRPGGDLTREILRRQVRHLDIAALDGDQLRALAEQRRVQMQLDIEVARQVALKALHRIGADILVGEDRGEADAAALLGLGLQDRRGGKRGGCREQRTASGERWHGRFPSLDCHWPRHGFCMNASGRDYRDQA